VTDEIPPPPDSVPKWADAKATAEEINWPNEKALQGQKDSNQMWALKATGVATVVLIVFFVLVFIFSLGFWIWHQLMPCQYLWMTEAQLSKVQSVIFSGSIGAIVSAYVRKHISK